MTDHRRLQQSALLMVGVLVAGLLAGVRPAPATGEDVVVGLANEAVLDCSKSLDGGFVAVGLRSPDVADYGHISRFWYKFEGYWSGTGKDWTEIPGWYWGSSDDLWMYTAEKGWTQLGPGYVVWNGYFATGLVRIWEQQSYYGAGTWAGGELTASSQGEFRAGCSTFQWSPIIGFPG